MSAPPLCTAPPLIWRMNSSHEPMRPDTRYSPAPSTAARRATWSTLGPPQAYVGSALRKNAGRSGSLYPVAYVNQHATWVARWRTPSTRPCSSPGQPSPRISSPIAARRSHASRQAAPEVTPLASTTSGPFRCGVPASGHASAACPSLSTLRHEDRRCLGGDLAVDHDLTRGVALAALLSGEAAADVDRNAVGRRAPQRRGERHRHTGRTRHERGDPEHFVERASQDTAVHAPGRTAVLRTERAPGEHLDRRRRRTGRGLLRTVDPLDRRGLRVQPTGPGLREALHA